MDRFDDKAREILRAIDADLRALMEPAMTLREGIIVRRLLSAVELRGGSDDTASEKPAVNWGDANGDHWSQCEGCDQCRPSAPASEPATCEGCGCVPCAGNGGECPGKMRRAEPSAVPASPQAETRGDLLERMAQMIDAAHKIDGRAGIILEGYGGSLHSSVRAYVGEIAGLAQHIFLHLAEYAAPPVQGDPPSHAAVAVEMAKRYGVENHGPWCVDAVRVANEMDNTSRRAFVAAAKGDSK